jgi:hypothetical protein
MKRRGSRTSFFGGPAVTRTSAPATFGVGAVLIKGQPPL